jgi:hypothetical protein
MEEFKTQEDIINLINKNKEYEERIQDYLSLFMMIFVHMEMLL